VLQPEEGQSYWQPIWANGYSIIKLSPKPQCNRFGRRCCWQDSHARLCDTHHHQYETILRGILAEGVLGSSNNGKKTYQGAIQCVFTPVY
jgi:hypothetical protein